MCLCDTLDVCLCAYIYICMLNVMCVYLYTVCVSTCISVCVCVCVCVCVSLCALSQVGIVLHYSTLPTALWSGVTARNIYKQATRKAKRYEELDEPPPPSECVGVCVCV